MAIETFEKLPKDKQQTILAAGIRIFATKSYAEAKTETITKECGISKGLLFHYFGSKREFYLYCLGKALEQLLSQTQKPAGDSFYDILFSFMDAKIRLCVEYVDEMHFVNMASRESASEVEEGKQKLIGMYSLKVREESIGCMATAVGTLPLKENASQQTAEAFTLYTNAVMNKYLLRYQKEPDEFFKNISMVKEEMKQYLDMMLYGICKGEGK